MKASLFPILVTVFIAAIILSCNKNKIEPSTASLRVKIEYESDGVPLKFDDIIYKNNAGNEYSVSKIEYLLSNFRLHKSDGSHSIPGVFYVNAASAETNTLLLDSIPPGHYHGISFYIGLNETQNVSNGLPSKKEFNDMYWPEQMGGGYHFIKFEGRYRDSATVSGYAIHLGLNPNLVKCDIEHHFDAKTKNQELVLKMNFNEWFRNPHIYDFDKDGNYSMHLMEAMKRLSENGRNVFKIMN